MGKRGIGEGTIYQRKDGRWVSEITVGWEGDRRIRKAFYGKTRAEVAGKLTSALSDQQLGKLVIGPNVKVAAYLSQWLEDVARPSIRPATYRCYDLAIRRLNPLIGRHKLENLKHHHIQKCYTTLLDSGLSRRTVELTHAVLHRALRQAVYWDLIGRNPADAVCVPRPARKEMQTLDHRQVEQLLESTRDDRLYPLWALLATSGLRLGEALGLKWPDINLEEGLLSVQRALQAQRGKGLVLVEPKTARSRRTVRLAGVAIRALREHHTKQLEERLKAGPYWDGSDFVFCNEIGRPVEPTGYNRAFRAALTKAGLPHIRIHDLRHTAATVLLSQGVHPKKVQEMLGHSTITLTLDVYSHVVPDMQDEIADKLDALYGTS